MLLLSRGSYPHPLSRPRSSCDDQTETISKHRGQPKGLLVPVAVAADHNFVEAVDHILAVAGAVGDQEEGAAEHIHEEACSAVDPSDHEIDRIGHDSGFGLVEARSIAVELQVGSWACRMRWGYSCSPEIVGVVVGVAGNFAVGIVADAEVAGRSFVDACMAKV